MDAVNLALGLIRVTVGVVFVVHGLKHVRNRAKTEAWVSSMGFGAPTIQWMFMSFAELAVGLGLIVGLLTSFAAAGVVSLMAVAFWTVHRHAGFWITARPDEGYEYVMTLSTAAVALALLGPGEWSLDHALGIADDLDGFVGLAIAGGGLAAAVGQLSIFYRPET